MTHAPTAISTPHPDALLAALEQIVEIACTWETRVRERGRLARSAAR